MSYEDFRNDFAATLEVPVETITDNFSMSKDAVWDSLAIISTIALIDCHFNIVVSGEELINLERFSDIRALLFAKAA
jgi:acyl carrier protein